MGSLSGISNSGSVSASNSANAPQDHVIRPEGQVSKKRYALASKFYSVISCLIPRICSFEKPNVIKGSGHFSECSDGFSGAVSVGDLTQVNLDRSKVDALYFMGVLSTDGSRLKRVWTDFAEESCNYDSTNFLQKFGRVLSVGVVTDIERQKDPTLEKCMDKFKADILEDWRNKDYVKLNEKLRDLESLDNEYLRQDGENSLNLSFELRDCVVNNFSELKNIFVTASENNSHAPVNSESSSKTKKFDKGLDAIDDLRSITFAAESFSDKPVEATDKVFSEVIDRLFKGYKDVIYEIHGTLRRNIDVDSRDMFKESLNKQGFTPSN
ncbi:hypothetical protein [Microbulbifer variabilis]|uniref:hypothetical protein n=1 Tax=Microbulbifer variabilis TaxID=266805 RepID=UPI001CFDC4BA|nr:hypothetical protein [Microbulbifer variabilis]